MRQSNPTLSEDIFPSSQGIHLPSTRYQGSKLKVIDWIWDNVKSLEFDTALDAFGGTGSVAYLLKRHGKEVTYNDYLKFNYYIGLALIDNNETVLSSEDTEFVLSKNKKIKYPTFIQDTFRDIYYTDAENMWLDMIVTNIEHLEDRYKKALAYSALFQACIIKRPYNLFHRKNLYMRTSNVERSFGNKATWDTPFEVHFQKFVAEINSCVFDNGRRNRAMNHDAFGIPGKYDLVYIDTPYISEKGVGVDYLDFYHFLEGLVNYRKWAEMIDYTSKHKKLRNPGSVWTDKNRISDGFDQLFKKYSDSILVVSYRAHGIPRDAEIVDLLKKYKAEISEVQRKDYKYVLSQNGTEELLFVAK